MSDTAAGLLFVVLLVLALAAAYRPLGDYMARVFTTTSHWRVEKVLYRVAGVDPDSDQRWPVYLRSLLAFSFVSVLLLYALERCNRTCRCRWGWPRFRPLWRGTPR